MADHQLDIATRLVHAGERQGQPVGQPVATPIYASTTFTYGSMAEADAVLGGEKPGYIYTRYGNPTVAALEQAILSLEGGVAACAYASGMAALHAALLACELSPGSIILASRDLYGATLDLLILLFGQFDVKTVTADFSDNTCSRCHTVAGMRLSSVAGLSVSKRMTKGTLPSRTARSAALIVSQAS